MRLVKIKDGRSSSTGRSATYQELISNYVFPNGKPSKFIPGNYYTAGDYVYVIDENNYAALYQCTSSGTSNMITTSNWKAVTLDSEVRGVIEEYLGVTAYDEYSVVFDHIGYTEDDIEVIIDGTDNMIKLPKDYKFNDHITLVINGIYRSNDLSDYSIIKYNGEYVIKLASSVDWANSTVCLNIDRPVNHNAKLFGYVDTLPSTIVDTTLYFALDDVLMSHSMTFDLYHDGILVPDDMYSVLKLPDDGLLMIQISTSYGRVVTDQMLDAFVLSITSSRSNLLKSTRKSYHITTDEDFERYRIELDDIVASVDDIRVYVGNHLLPYNVIHIMDGVLSITRLENYATVGDIIHITNDSYEVELTQVKSNSDSIVVAANETTIPIPIINYDESIHDVLIFKESGIYVSRSRYYIKDGYVVFYPHDTSLVEGDVLYFQIFNEDESVSIRSKLIEYKPSVLDGIAVPKGLKGKYSSFLLFNANGLHIPQTAYSLSSDGATIVFNQGANLTDGDIVELVFNQYLDTYTSTVTKTSNTIASADNKINLPLNNYVEDRYKTILFNNTTGAYIDASRYSISDTFVLTLTEGTGISRDDNVDIYFIVNLPSKISPNTLQLEIMSL